MMTWYTGDPTYDTVLTFAFGLVVLVFIGAAVMKSPYGRFASDKWGVNLSPRLGWFLMELPATLSFVFFYFQGRNRFDIVPLFFLFVWLIHYGNRGFVFPYLIRSPKGATASFSIMIVVMGWFVTTLHGYLNAVFISDLGTHFGLEWFFDPRFIIGIILYYGSFVLNIRSDAIIRNLRSVEEIERGEKVYRIPQGGLFRFVTNPSYLAEITAFAGWLRHRDLVTWCNVHFAHHHRQPRAARVPDASLVQGEVPGLPTRTPCADPVRVVATACAWMKAMRSIDAWGTLGHS
jgi:3-oxo-5-alpha-steroid 4-dehydrogenase 1